MMYNRKSPRYNRKRPIDPQLQPEVQHPLPEVLSQHHLELPSSRIDAAVSDVQPQQPDVQSGDQKLPSSQIDALEQSQTAVPDVQSGDQELPSSRIDALEQSQSQTAVSDVQLQQPDVQSGDQELPDHNNSGTAKLVSKPSGKKYKKKNNNNVWTRTRSRKGKKKNKGNHVNAASAEERVLISPIIKFPDKNDNSPDSSICLSKAYKEEKVEISEDRMSAGSTKGYRMVRATRGVVEGAWYFEIKVMHLGETGHTRLGWTTEKGDLQAPVGFDSNSFGYRDGDGSKVHKALREAYGEGGYGEGDVLGFYISLPDGSSFEPSPPRYVWFKGQRYVCAPDGKVDPPKVVPGSEICFFKNGNCQGTAFTDLFGGRYFPAASMFTLPNQSNCLVKFNFGPDFDSFPVDFGGRPIPRPMIEVPYHGCDGKVENGSGSSLWNSTRTSTMLKVTKEKGTLFVEASEMDID